MQTESLKHDVRLKSATKIHDWIIYNGNSAVVIVVVDINFHFISGLIEIKCKQRLSRDSNRYISHCSFLFKEFFFVWLCLLLFANILININWFIGIVRTNRIVYMRINCAEVKKIIMNRDMDRLKYRNRKYSRCDFLQKEKKSHQRRFLYFNFYRISMYEMKKKCFNSCFICMLVVG